MIDTWLVDGDLTDYIVICDKCNYEETFNEIRYWDELLSEMRQMGWKIQKSNKSNKWLHHCSDCVAKKNNPFKPINNKE
jgi:hypothetical protein